jgi:hypothetical protein
VHFNVAWVAQHSGVESGRDVRIGAGDVDAPTGGRVCRSAEFDVGSVHAQFNQFAMVM